MDSLSPQKKDYRLRRGELSAYGRAFNSAKRLRMITLMVGVVIVLVLLATLLFAMQAGNSPMLVMVGLVAVMLLLVGGLWGIHRFTSQHFIEPDLAFRMWLQQVCDGELDSRITLDPDHQHYKELNFHTMNLATSLSRLSDDMDNLVESQTLRLNDQKRVLELLFKLTADLSGEPENKAVFETVCEYMAEWFESARVSCYRVVESDYDTANRALQCVARWQSQGNGKAESIAPGSAVGEDFCTAEIPTEIIKTSCPDSPSKNRRLVPFFAGSDPAGMLVIDIDEAQQSERIETRRVLTTVSEQLSHLCGKQLVQEQMLEARLSRDRNELAAEIHDSLAQTLLAVRYQTTVLSDKLKSHSEEEVLQDVLSIRGSIEEANEEIRGLIRENRSPLSEHRYADSLQVDIDHFSQDSGIGVFFQSDDPDIRFTPREESVLQRIITEALNNARKYASATTIRVYLQRTASGVRRILVEDDGVGFVHRPNVPSAPKDSGEHIGLTIMRERAVSIGAKLLIDSEPGEGTRITITMPPLIESRSAAR